MIGNKKNVAACMVFALFLSACGTIKEHTHKAETAPAPVMPVPTQAQLAWHDMELYAFIHFGLNTFNDLEWGYGDTPASTFKPPHLHVEQWVTTLKAAGMKGVILTAKHHDGFCLWPTKTTDYSVKNSPWKNGRGDLVRELSDACRKHGLKFGLYLSPWDRHHAEYGREEYRTVFLEQIRELTSSYGTLFEYWFDGANGGTGWYGGTNESRQIDPQTYYRYHLGGELLRKNNPDIMIFGGTEPTIRWVGNERGVAGETNWNSYDYAREKHYTQAQWGMSDADQWLPAECDVSIRPGWFYHQREDHQVKSAAELVDLYYKSVGRGATLLLNCPIDLEGRIPREDSLSLMAFYRDISHRFTDNLIAGKAKVRISASAVRSKKFSAEKLTDGDNETFWATPDSVTAATVEVTFEQPVVINNIMLREYLPLGQRISRFSIDFERPDGSIVKDHITDSLTTIGHKRLLRFRRIEVKTFRLHIEESRGPVCLSELGAYRVDESLIAPEVRIDANDSLLLFARDPDSELFYTIDRGAPVRYEHPVLLPDSARMVTAYARRIPGGKESKQTVKELGVSHRFMQVKEDLGAEVRRLFDGSGFSAFRLPDGVRRLTLCIRDRQGQPAAMAVNRLVYTPDQQRDARGHIQRYRVLSEGKILAEGEFQNIKNNPIPVEIPFSKAVRTDTIVFEVLKTVDDEPFCSIGDLGLMRAD
ncbi:alpha-L-fucosidase [Porphyromonas macacae]|uniref:alpha-L-fucosidase n=1 Tax=Porphyromonas macacae TaxID=28115 RepID=UPI0024AD5A94|nr:alpha-L-fucosidase [Porphyromonas macacae]